MRSVRTISRKDLTKEEIGFFIAGFTEGEGSFNVSLRKKDDYAVKWQVVMSFNVSQKERSILDLIQKEIDCGIIKVRKRDGLYSLDVTSPSNIIQKVIPYFQKYPLLSVSKVRNFQVFCQIADLMDEGQHKTISGLYKIVELREELNEGKGRKRKYTINDIFPK